MASFIRPDFNGQIRTDFELIKLVSFSSTGPFPKSYVSAKSYALKKQTFSKMVHGSVSLSWLVENKIILYRIKH